jgi:predicted PurR-regulated permease PerM
MTAPIPKRPPVVRLPPKSNLELLLSRGAQVAVIFAGFVALGFTLHAGQLLLAPLAFAIVVGLMLGPVASRLEARGIPPAISAIAVVVVFVLVVGAFAAAIATPLAYWSDRIPQMWSALQLKFSNLREPLQTIRALRDEVRSTMGDSNVTVSVEDTSPVESMASLAPPLIAQILIVFAGLYFFVATRHDTRTAILKLCFNRKLRWRVAHIFRDVEALVSKYLLSITVINIGLGVAVGLGMWLIGVPSPAMWGALAALLNFVIYIGPAVMAFLLFLVGLASFDALSASVLPPLLYLALNMIEAQFVTPTVIGRAMTLNPFVVFLALAFWLWIWGPIGGFIAIPALLIIHAVCWNIIPGIEWLPPKPQPRAMALSEKVEPSD